MVLNPFSFIFQHVYGDLMGHKALPVGKCFSSIEVNDFEVYSSSGGLGFPGGRQGDPRRGRVKVVRGASPTGGPEEDKQAALYCSAGITQELSA